MVLRDLILGGGASCQVPDGASSSSNPLGGLVDSLLGSSSKSQETLRELPAVTEPGGGSHLFSELAPHGSLVPLPGSEFHRDRDGARQSSAQGQFLHHFSSSDRNFSDAWEELSFPKRPLPSTTTTPFQDADQLRHFSEFEGIYDQERGGPPPAHAHGVLSSFLHSFLDSSRAEAPFPIVRLPKLGLSHSDKQRIRDRSSIMARHFFADKGDDFVSAQAMQVTALLQSLDIEDGFRRAQPSGLEEYWKEAQGAWPAHTPGMDTNADAWAHTFTKQLGANKWADEFAPPPSGSWANEFEEGREMMGRGPHMAGAARDNQAVLDQTSSLVHTLSQNQDPKFKNSKFLQFVSKMSRGELIIEDNHVKKDVGTSENRWAHEFHEQHDRNGDVWWAGEHVHDGDNWVDEFTYGGQSQASVTGNDRSQAWADDFSQQVVEGAFGKDGGQGWLDTYDKFVEEQLNSHKDQGAASRFLYVFSDQNPYVGHPSPLREGQDLFRRGLLSEAVLALEAEVLKNPENSEGWRLLGITHAENDDDRQAIASMVQARNADPTNLEVLLALGVSHTNEFEQAEALQYLLGWLKNHPKYHELVQPEDAGHLSHVEAAKLFNIAASMSPEDGDVHTVLGVLYNLSREYEKAISSFQTALKLKPRDYSLWNKLGATQANSARSADAISAYQQALDLKPNYVRAWSNMGIGFANQSRYEESIHYYVRALSMNPKAENVWQYLRMSLSCAGRMDLLAACDGKDLQVLQEKYQM